MLAETDEVRKLYMDAQLLAHHLTSKMAGLQAAATVAGTRVTRQEELISLTVDPGELHRRLVWECWHTEGGRPAVGVRWSVSGHEYGRRTSKDSPPIGNRSRCRRSGFPAGLVTAASLSIPKTSQRRRSPRRSAGGLPEPLRPPNPGVAARASSRIAAAPQDGRPGA